MPPPCPMVLCSPPFVPWPPRSAWRGDVLPISGTHVCLKAQGDLSQDRPLPLLSPSSLWTLFRLTGKDWRLFASFPLWGILEDCNFVCSLLYAVASSNTSVLIFCILSIADISSSTAGPQKEVLECTHHTAPDLSQWLSLLWTSWRQRLGWLPRHLLPLAWALGLAQCVAGSLEAVNYCWVIIKLNLMIMRWFCVIALWVDFTHKLAICGRALVSGRDYHVRLLGNWGLELRFFTPLYP